MIIIFFFGDVDSESTTGQFQGWYVGTLQNKDLTDFAGSFAFEDSGKRFA